KSHRDLKGISYSLQYLRHLSFKGGKKLSCSLKVRVRDELLASEAQCLLFQMWSELKPFAYRLLPATEVDESDDPTILPTANTLSPPTPSNSYPKRFSVTMRFTL